MRIVFTSDWHLSNQKEVQIKVLELFQEIRRVNPDFIVFGGDMIRDGLKDPSHLSATHWQLWQNAIAQIKKDYACLFLLGNHDLQYDEEPNVKQRSLENYELNQPYWATKINDWLFLGLDSNFYLNQGDYLAKLDSEQWLWMQNQIDRHNGPIGVFSHIPILSAAVFHDGDLVENNQWRIPNSWIHIDSKQIHKTFSESAKIQFCVSGHLHLFEKIHYDNIWYICGGSLSSNWWDGVYQGTPSGFLSIEIKGNKLLDVRYKQL